MSPNSQKSGPSDAIDVRDLLDPDLREVLGAFEIPPFDAETILAIRSAPFPGMALSDAVVRTEQVVPGEPPIPVRVHRHVGADGAQPGIFSIHGGGYVIGSYDMDDYLHDRWSRSSAPWAYRCSTGSLPRRPIPARVEDCYAALRWAHEHAGEIGVDPARLGIYGISAGGGLAAALALLVRDRGEFPLAFQLLDCPMLDDSQTTPSIGSKGLYVVGRRVERVRLAVVPRRPLRLRGRPALRRGGAGG